MVRKVNSKKRDTLRYPAMKLVRQLADMAFPSRVAFTMPTSRSLAGCSC
jgi:hypothetical protein